MRTELLCKHESQLIYIFCRIHDKGFSHILFHYGECRADVYKRLFQILHYGNGLGKKQTGKPPTFIFPMEIRQEIRSRFSDGVAGSQDYEFQQHEDTFSVTWEQLRGTKWPNPPKTCRVCNTVRVKPYWVQKHFLSMTEQYIHLLIVV